MYYPLRMLRFDDARARILSNVLRVSSERIPLRDAAARVLAVDLVAGAPLPGFDYSAMDGYALAVADVAGDGPWRMPMAGESRAGGEAQGLKVGVACRILTGAPLPQRADAVIMQEKVTVEKGAICFDVRPTAGQNIRRAGEDLARGALAIAAGTRLSAGGVALASAAPIARSSPSRATRESRFCARGTSFVPRGRARVRPRSPNRIARRWQPSLGRPVRRCAWRPSPATIRRQRSGPSRRRSMVRTSS